MYPDQRGTTATKQTLAYNQQVGVEAAVEDLREASGYHQADIFLFSVELFNKELNKFNLKLKAEVAEQKAAYEEALANSK